MSIYNRTIQIRLSRWEKEQIISRMHGEGYHNISAWIRKTLLTDTKKDGHPMCAQKALIRWP